MALAILGGSFDPVHNGHVAMAQYVLGCGEAEEILVVPARQSPFKNGSRISAEDRLQMTRLAFHPLKKCTVDDLEIRRPGPSYMIDTLEELKGRHPATELRLIVGADNVSDFFDWQQAVDILALAKVLVLGRNGIDLTVPPEYSSQFVRLPEFDQRVSSTEIRVMLAQRKSVASLLPSWVLQYIRDHDLYT